VFSCELSPSHGDAPVQIRPHRPDAVVSSMSGSVSPLAPLRRPGSTSREATEVTARGSSRPLHSSLPQEAVVSALPPVRNRKLPRSAHLPQCPQRRCNAASPSSRQRSLNRPLIATQRDSSRAFSARRHETYQASHSARHIAAVTSGRVSPAAPSGPAAGPSCWRLGRDAPACRARTARRADRERSAGTRPWRCHWYPTDRSGR